MIDIVIHDDKIFKREGYLILERKHYQVQALPFGSVMFLVKDHLCFIKRRNLAK